MGTCSNSGESSQRRERDSRERVRRERVSRNKIKLRETVEKSQNTVLFNALGLGRVEKSALHATVSRSTC